LVGVLTIHGMCTRPAPLIEPATRQNGHTPHHWCEMKFRDAALLSVYALLDAIDRGCIDEAVSIFSIGPTLQGLIK
jgi:hypothetical protein